MPDFDPTQPPAYNTMQQQVGLLPPAFQPPATIFPGQMSQALAQGMFPTQQFQTFTTGNPYLQGPTGVLMPMQPGAPYNTYPGMSPMGRGPGYQGPPGLHTPLAPAPPPVYPGQMGALPGFAPPPAPMFNTLYGAGLEREQQTSDMLYSRGWATAGLGARFGANLTAGLAGAAVGGRFGLAGAAIGGALGFAGAELSGFGRGAQNLFMGHIAAPFLQQRAMAGGIEELSQNFVTGGAHLHARGVGFSHHAASEAAQGLRTLSESGTFQGETRNRFNQQDLLKITQQAGRSDMLTGVQSPEQLTERVRNVAKSLSSFMELAQEPDIQRALQSMSSLRASGLNLSETLQAVSHGRAFARMAGTSFSELAQTAGAMGSQTFQAMGMTQGLGIQAGMMNFGLARASQNMGVLNPQLMNLLGGAQGYANMNNMYSATALQAPMLAPSVMSASGGININALQNLLSGNTNAFSQTTNAAGALQRIAGAQGPQGLGMAIAMQPLLQDTLGRSLQAQGPFAQRNFEDQNIISTMRQMGMRGSSGFMTMAQTMGMSQSQALARAQELGDPRYWESQRAQIETSRREGRAAELDRWEREKPGLLDDITHYDPTGLVGRARRFGQDIGGAFRHFGHLGEELSEASGAYTPEAVETRRDFDETLGSRRLWDVMGDTENRMRPRAATFQERMRAQYQFSRLRSGGVLPAFVNSLRGHRTEADLNQQLEQYSQASQFAEGMLNSSRQETIAAQRRIGATFGEGRIGTERMVNFTQDALRTLTEGREPLGSPLARMGINAFARGASNIATMGLVDSGNILERGLARGEDIENAFVRSMRGSGRSETDLRSLFQRERGTISRQIHSAALFMGDPRQIAGLRDTVLRGQGLTGLGGTGFQEEALHREAAGVQALFGRGFGDDAHEREISTQIFDRVARNVGEFGSSREDRRASRELLTAAAMYQSVLSESTDPNERAKARQQLGRLYTTMQTRFGPERTADMTRRLAGSNLAQTFAGDPRTRDAARAFTQQTGNLQSGEAILNQVRTGRTMTEEGAGMRRLAGGASTLERRSGIIGEVFRGIGGEQFSRTRLQDRIGELSEDQLERLRSEGGVLGGRLAQAAEQMRSDNAETAARGQEALQRLLGQSGEREAALRERYRREHSGLVAGIARGLGFGESEAQFVQRELAGGTAADRRAEAQLDATRAAEESAQGAGIGTAADSLLQATRELREVSANLNSVLQGGALNQAIAGYE